MKPIKTHSLTYTHFTSVIFLFVLLLNTQAGRAQNQGLPMHPDDLFTRRAVQLALLGHIQEIQNMYIERQNQEFSERGVGGRMYEGGNYLEDNVLDLYASMASQISEDELNESLVLGRAYGPRDENSIFFDAMARQKLYEHNIKTLRHRIFFSRFSSVFNRIGRAASQLLTGETIAVLQLPVDTVYAAWRVRVANPMERKLLVNMNQLIARGRFYGEPMKMQKKLQKLGEKRKRALVLEDMQRGKMAYREGDIHIAAFYFQKANQRDRNNKDAREWRDKILRELRDRQHARELSNILSTQSRASNKKEEKTAQEITRLLAVASWEESTQRAQEWALKDPKNAPADEVDLLDAVAAYALGYKHRARVYLVWIAANYKYQSAGRYARGLLNSPYHFPRLKIKEAQARHRSETRRYILWGYPVEDYAYLTASEAAALQPAWVQNVAIFFVLDSTIRGIFCLFSNPISDDGILDAATEALHRNGRDQDEEPLKRLLVDTYKDARRYDQALLYSENPRERDKLKKKEVKKLYRQILQVHDLELRHYLFERLLEEYPETPYRSKIESAMAKLDERIYDEALMTKKQFREYLPIFNETCFYFEPAYLDGEKSNGEMGSKGITLRRDRTLVFHETYMNEDRVIPITEVDYPTLKSFFEFHGRLVRLEKARKSSEMAEKVYFELRGGLGSSGVDLYPGIAPAQMSEDEAILYQ